MACRYRLSRDLVRHSRTLKKLTSSLTVVSWVKICTTSKVIGLAVAKPPRVFALLI